MMFLKRAAAIAGIALCLAASHASAQESPAFEWKHLNVYIGTTTGGGYDAYARLLSRHIGRHLPGKPSPTPINRPGAGGLALMNQVYASGAKDGTDLAVVAPGFVLDHVFYGDQSKAMFDPVKFNWIGNMAQDPSVFVAWKSKGYNLADILAGKEMTVGMPGPGGGPWFYSRALNALFGAKLKVVSGYPGVAEVLMAIENGELDGVAGTTWSGLKATKGHWFSSNSAEVLLAYTKQRLPDLPDVPAVSEIIKNDETRSILDVISGLEAMNRPVFSPPAIPPARVATLRKAFDETAADPEFLADAKKLALPIAASSGAQVQELVGRIAAPPEAIVKRLRDIYRE